LKDHEQQGGGNDEDNFAALNQNKRDRRTIEEIQKLDKHGKRQRVD
jgi:hypothetical protein